MDGDIIPILQDVILEAQTTSRWLEFDDPVVDSFRYIEHITKCAIEKLEEDA